MKSRQKYKRRIAMPEMPRLDALSLRILEVLQSDSEISMVDLAERVGGSTSACWRRVSELKNQGVIQRSVAIVDPLALDLAVNVFVQVSLERQDRKSLETFDAAVRTRPEIMECYLMSGESDYMLRVVVRDLIEFKTIMLDFITKIPGVASIRSSFALSQVKYSTALPVHHLGGQGG